MNKHPTALMLALTGLMLAIIGLGRLQKVWKYCQPNVWLPLPVVVAGVLIGYIDLHNDEVWTALILLLLVAFIFGLVSPQRAWQWALLVSLGISLAWIGALLVGYTLICHPGIGCPSLNTIITLQTFMALVPAFIGAYSGAGLRWGLVHWSSKT